MSDVQKLKTVMIQIKKSAIYIDSLAAHIHSFLEGKKLQNEQQV
jgi:hypothetical protein